MVGFLPSSVNDSSQVAKRVHAGDDRNVQMNGRSSMAIRSAPQTKAGCRRRLRHVSQAMHA